MKLDAIIQYELNEIDAKAYKVCLLWEKICQHEIPTYRYDRLKGGDPRKSFLFKCCRKLVTETQGLVTEDMYKYYVYAQITSLKNFSDGKIHALIEPPCLFGPNAWLRWKIWKTKFDKIQHKTSFEGTTDDIIQNKSSILKEFQQTKKFLLSRLESITPATIKKSLTEKTIHKWLSFSKVSPYFIVLSKTVKEQVGNIEDNFGFDPYIYIKQLSDEDRVTFKSLFGDV